MSLDDAFLTDIIEHPGDDAPRLIYADWLEEQDDPDSQLLAEFIRVQMALESPPDEGPELWALQRRQDELLAYGRIAWLGEVRELVLRERFRRGFVHTVTMEPGQFLEHADEVFALAPIQGLHLRGLYNPTGNAATNDLLAAVARSPRLRQITHLHLELPLHDEGARALAESTHLTSLRELAISSFDLTADLRRLLDSPVCSSLRALSISSNGYSPSDLLAALSASSLAGLHTLRLTRLGPAAVEQAVELLTSPRLSGLRVFELRSNHALSLPVLQALGQAPFLSVLEELDLSENAIGENGIRAWLNHASAPNLRRLALSRTSLHAAALEALAEWPGMPNLRELDLRDNVGGGAGLTALARSNHLTHLAVLRMHFNGVTDDGVITLADTGRLRDLVWLDLITNRITDFGAWAILDLPDLGRLARLELARNAISPENQQEMTARFGGIVRF